METLGALVAGALPDVERAKIANHAASCEGCLALMEGLVHSRGGAGGSSASGDMAVGGIASELELHRGMQVGRYMIEDRLGTGGMGVVHAAFDTELHRLVAVKVLRRGRSEGHGAGGVRLMREARTLARLSHPNVVTVFDVGTHQGQLFVAMELVDGGSLREWLRTPRALEDIIDRLVEAGRGLAAAHSAGVVHRDVKPDNILVSRDGRARVTDFGLAHPAEVDAVPPQTSGAMLDAAGILTRTGAVIGTPAYMAPEQRLRGQTDWLTDQWSFCVTLYEAVAGRRPFVGDGEASLAIAEGRFATPPSGRRVPGWLQRIVARGLRDSPAQRWPSMDAVVRALVRGRQRRRYVAAWISVSVVLAGVALAVLLVREDSRAIRQTEPPVAGWKDTRPGCNCPYSACTDHCLSICDASRFRLGAQVPGISVAGRQEALLGASSDGNAILFLAGEGCSRDRLMLARRRGATFEPVDLTDQLDPRRVSWTESCCTLSADGESLIMTTADRTSLVRLRLVGSTLQAGDTAEFRDLLGSSSVDHIVAFPVLSADGLTLYYSVWNRAAEPSVAAFQAPYASKRAHQRSPFPTGRLVGPPGRFENVTGVSSDGLSLFMKSDWETRVLVRASTAEPFGSPAPGVIPARLPGWRTLPLAGCERLLTTSTPGGCEHEDITYLEAVPR